MFVSNPIGGFMSNEIEKEIISLVDEVTDKKTFNIIEAISNRSYPHTSVNVFLNESLAFDAAQLEEEILSLELLSDDVSLSRVLELQEKLDNIIEELSAQKYVFHIYGISEGEREEILNATKIKYPVEYDEEKNPYTGAVTKVEKDNAERDRLFTILLWKSQIRKIVSADGSVQENLIEHDIEQLRSALPVAAIAEINNAIEKVRASTAMFMAKVNQDFLAKR
jgi:hypothetical protein